MSEELKTSEELAREAETSVAETPEITETAAPEEPAETMADYAEELEASFKQIHEGDILTGTVIGVSESEITLDLKYYTEGIIRLEDFTSDPGFNLKEDVHIGDEISATVIRRDDGEGHILLSSKEANDILAWDKFKKYMEEGTNLTVKVGGIVKSGVVAYLDGIRGFIPASRLSLNYVEEDALNDWLGKELEVRVINADTENKRLVLSAREILREKADEERKAKSFQRSGRTRYRRNRRDHQTLRCIYQPWKWPVRSVATFLRSAKNVSKHRRLFCPKVIL